jgi:two-component system, NarL family, response regulator YdfI
VIRVFIVAASSLARTGTQNLFAERDVEVVGSAANLESLAALWPDVVADVVLIDASGEQLETLIDSLASSQIASEANVVFLNDRTESSLIVDALRTGVRAILPSHVSPDQLVAALESAAAGLIVVHPAEVNGLFPAATPASRAVAELAEPLTARESEVLQMLASGLANKEIAARLLISEHTVKFHVASILGKLGAGSRTEAVALGMRRGLVLL